MIEWNKFYTWQLVLPPSRPDKMQLGRIRKALDSLDRNSSIAILGSTPEFRDLCYKMNFKDIWIFDKNKEFYNITKSMMETATNRERLVWGDWLDTIPKYNNKFSAILSDLTMGNIHYDLRFAFYTSINAALSDHGIFIDKVLMHDYFLDVQTLLEDYSTKPLNLATANNFNCQMIFCSKLVERYGCVNTSEIYNYLEGMDQEAWLKPLLDYTRKITPDGCIWYYGKLREDVEDKYLQHFCLLQKWEEPITSPYYKFAHHYILGKKRKNERTEQD